MLLQTWPSGSQISRILVSGFYPAANLLTSGVIVCLSCLALSGHDVFKVGASKKQTGQAVQEVRNGAADV